MPPAIPLDQTRDPFVLLRVVGSIARAMEDYLDRSADWRDVVAAPAPRNAAFEQILFAHEALDRLMLVMLSELEPGGWREPLRPERVSSDGPGGITP